MAASNRIGIACILAPLLLSATLTLPALAQTAAFDLPSQPLAQALKALAIQADLDIYFDPPTVRGIQAPSVRATLSVQEALHRLLSGTHLHAIQVDAHTIRVVTEGEFLRLQHRPNRMTDGDNRNSSPSAVHSSRLSAGSGAAGTISTPAAGPPADDDPQQTYSTASAQLNEVIVTAEKTQESLLDVPMSLSAVTGTELTRSHSFRFEDYVGQIPGVSMVDYGGLGSQIVIRGITSGSIPINSAVATYIDETPFTSEGPFAGSYIMTPDLDTFDMQRIEVLRGPQGTLYGANSLGGVVRYITAAPDPSSFSSTIEAGLSSVYNGSIGHDVHAMVNLPLMSDAAFRIVGYTNFYPGYVDDPSRGLTDTNGSHYSGYRASLLYQPLPTLSIRLNSVYQDLNWNDYSNEDVQGGSLRPLYGSLIEHELIGNSGSRIVKLYNATINWDTSIAKLMSATSYYSLQPHAQYEYPTLNSVINGLFGNNYPGAAVSFNEPVRALTEEVRATSATSGPLHWIGGLYFTNERAGEDEDLLPITAAHTIAFDFSPAIGNFLIPVKYKERAAYLNLDYDLFQNLDFAAGARYSSNDQTFHETGVGLFAGGVSFGNTSSEHVATYSADLRWHFMPTQMLYTRFSEGFAPGGPNDSFTGNTLPVTYSSSNTKNYEAGLKSRLLDGRLTVEVSGFHIDWNKIQLQAVIKGFGGIVNGGSAESNGFEWDFAVAPTRGLNLSLDGAYTDAHLTQDTPASVNGHTGDRLPGVPLWSGAVNAQYGHSVFGDYAGFAAVSWQYTDTRYSDFIAGSQREILPSFGMLNLRVGVRGERWSLALYARNLANVIAINYVQPETSAGGAGPQDAEIYTPRTIGATATYHIK